MKISRSFKIISFLCFWVFSMLSPNMAMANPNSDYSILTEQQPTTLKGRVVDNKAEAIIGASIIVKGTNIGTITNMDGNFELNVSSLNLTIVVSYVGYKTLEMPLNGKNNITITINEDNALLDEVVVVGYGSQKKVNLTGSVSSVNMSELAESRPVTNISSGLAGLAAGVYVNSSSNRPNNDNASIMVRGQGTLNNSSPLVIVDGVESNIANVNPEDIENMSVLKDAASSSIYGSRAANGVILITTKKGKAGKIEINYNGYLSLQSVANTIEPVTNYANYMELINEGMKNSNQSLPFSQGSIDTWRSMEGKEPLKYPNNDWRKEVFKTSNSQNHALSLSGGADNVRFFSSFRYMDNPGVIEKAGVTKYDIRTNVEAKLKKWISIGTNLNAGTSNLGLGTYALDDVFTFAQASTPGLVLRSPDGRYGSVSNLEENSQSNNVLQKLNNTTGEDKMQRGGAKFYTNINPFSGFTVTSSFSYDTYNEKRWSKPVFIDRWNFLTDAVAIPGKGRTNISNYAAKTDRYFMDISGTYEKTLFDRLNLKAMAGASQEQYSSENFSTSKLDLIDPSLSVIDAAVGDASSSGSKFEWAMRSYFGRVNLTWSDKYLLELNLRADGSSRFLSNKRWGYFPSFSAGWRIDQESFMSSLLDKGLSSLKLRASYGSLGNNSVGNYDALSVYSIGNYVLNGSVQQGLYQNSIANSLLTWEQTYMANFGLDFSFFNNRLSSTIDVFNKKTVGILISLPAPLVHGTASIPKQNSATVVNNGIELTLGWQDKVGDFNYYVKGNLSYIQNEVTKYKGDDYTIVNNGLIKEGLPIGIQYLLTADRIISSDDDLALVQKMIDNAPIDPITNIKKNPFAAYGKPSKGDLLYKDMNDDGVINDDDKTTFGSGANPTIMYGVTLGASYKGFDFSTLLQGTAGLKMYYADQYYNPSVRWGYQINQEIADGRWYEGRTTPAKFPRLLNYSDTKNTRPSDFWLADKSYFKIRNIQLGYSLPKTLLKKVEIERVRFYVSLENYFTFTSYRGIDPEVSNTDYPSMRQAVFGFNFTF